MIPTERIFVSFTFQPRDGAPGEFGFGNDVLMVGNDVIDERALNKIRDSLDHKLSAAQGRAIEVCILYWQRLETERTIPS